MKLITIAITALLLSGCLHTPIHQGNRLDADKVAQIQQGQTRFQVEQLLGTPMLNSTLHPNRVTYYEEFKDEESGNMIKRGVEISYDNAWRVKRSRDFGFSEGK